MRPLVPQNQAAWATQENTAPAFVRTTSRQSNGNPASQSRL